MCMLSPIRWTFGSEVLSWVLVLSEPWYGLFGSAGPFPVPWVLGRVDGWMEGMID